MLRRSPNSSAKPELRYFRAPQNLLKRRCSPRESQNTHTMGLGFRALLEEGTSEQSLSRLQSGGLSGSSGRSSKAHARLNFLELRTCELRRITLPRTWVNTFTSETLVGLIRVAGVTARKIRTLVGEGGSDERRTVAAGVGGTLLREAVFLRSGERRHRYGHHHCCHN